MYIDDTSFRLVNIFALWQSLDLSVNYLDNFMQAKVL